MKDQSFNKEMVLIIVTKNYFFLTKTPSLSAFHLPPWKMGFKFWATVCWSYTECNRCALAIVMSPENVSKTAVRNIYHFKFLYGQSERLTKFLKSVHKCVVVFKCSTIQIIPYAKETASSFFWVLDWNYPTKCSTYWVEFYSKTMIKKPLKWRIKGQTRTYSSPARYGKKKKKSAWYGC